MCGIGGVVRFDGRPVAQDGLERMAAVMAHRGPDGSGVWTAGSVGLVNRRLAIIDLSHAADQPMTSADGRCVITYNGEVFNYREIRADLEGRGIPFRSRSDTEVVLAAFQERGAACAPSFNGQFAFAVWDARRRRVVLARDRMGIKPLYYLLAPDRLVFASEIRAILVHADVPRRLCYPALDEYFTFQNTLGEHTLFEGIRLLSPGTVLSVAIDGTERRERYWSPRPAADRPADPRAAASDVREALDRAVRRQLVADVPVGSYLSGGMDSGSVAALARRSIGPLHTFTLGFDMSGVDGSEARYDEREAARRTAERIGSLHHEAVLGSAGMEGSMDAVVTHLEELRVGQSYPNYAVAALAHPFVKVVLSGTGGDELFAGYPWRYAPALTAASPGEFVDGAYRLWQRLVTDDEKPAFFRPRVRWEKGRTLEAFRGVLRDAGTPLRERADFLDASLYFDVVAFLHGLLVVEDKLGMAHSLEVRVPLLDNDLVDLALSLPAHLKLRPMDGTAVGKVVLREAVRPIVGEDVASRPKQGFSAPDATWFRTSGRRWTEDALGDARARLYEVVEPAAVRRILDEHRSGARERRLLIWSLVAFERWLRIFEVAT